MDKPRTRGGLSSSRKAVIKDIVGASAPTIVLLGVASTVITGGFFSRVVVNNIIPWVKGFINELFEFLGFDLNALALDSVSSVAFVLPLLLFNNSEGLVAKPLYSFCSIIIVVAFLFPHSDEISRFFAVFIEYKEYGLFHAIIAIFSFIFIALLIMWEQVAKWKRSSAHGLSVDGDRIDDDSTSTTTRMLQILVFVYVFIFMLEFADFNSNVQTPIFYSDLDDDRTRTAFVAMICVVLLSLIKSGKRSAQVVVGALLLILTGLICDAGISLYDYLEGNRIDR